MAVCKIRVLVVDDSILFREMLIHHLELDPCIEIAGYAVDCFDALEKIESLRPDVITLDVEMPKMNGIEFLKKLIPVNPYPVVVVSSLNINVLDALEAGAVDFVKKPVVKKPGDLQDFFIELVSMIKVASIAKIGSRRSREPKKDAAAATPKTDPTVSQKRHERLVERLKEVIDRSQESIEKTRQTIALRDPSPQKLSRQEASQKESDSLLGASPHQGKVKPSLVAVGASTGGTEAVFNVIRHLPASFPCVLVVQHMPAGFTRMYAERIDRNCIMTVKECEDGDRIEPGLVIIAAGDHHMWVEKDSRGLYVRSQKGERVSGHCPSVDVLFNSVADVVGGSAVGVILTGMGSDGAKGLLNMRKQGSCTIGQDKDTSVVYGMPMVSYNIGAVEKQLPLEHIASELMKL